MKSNKFTEVQIMLILKQAESSVPVAQLCREHSMGNSTFYKWRARYGGLDASALSELKSLEAENKRLKKMYAEMSMQNEILKEVLEKK